MLLIIIVGLLTAFLFKHLYWKRRNFPPGPTPLPFLGNLTVLKNYEPGYECWKKLKEDYGPVYTFWLASLPSVVIADYEIIKQTIIKDGGNYVGRPYFPISGKMRGGQLGLIEAVDDRWVQHRRFSLQVLRDFGLGKNLMEEKVIIESQNLIELLKKQMESGPVDIQNNVDSAVGSIINNILFGYRFDESNMEQFLTMKVGLARHFELAAHPIGMIIGMYPFLENFPYFKDQFKIVVNNWNTLYDLFGKQIEEHEKIIDYDTAEYSDYVEAFLKEKKKHEDEPDFGGFEIMQLKNMCFDLWVAGMETTANTLYWSVLYVLLDEEVHRKVKKELRDVIGSDRVITSTDKSSLNYVNATLNEIQRLANLLPQNLSRVVGKDTVIGGHLIKAGTILTPQISAVLYDDKIFPDPYRFDPTRFLDENGNVKKIEEFIPFSVGKRQCLGEGLAKLELFIFFANFFNQFDAEFDPAGGIPTTKKRFGVTMKAENYKLVLKNSY
ncbi:unnamed protein product [Caenorhabditis auriculariae]|uniref:CYtochrome P450 family n=1 Tax=Caenorhabditis auriculariae TaxID=2777116 RepID=A0A8S1HG54_9PELO|nr:unnamed protein product [Caenorhabditis auriculariae]